MRLLFIAILVFGLAGLLWTPYDSFDQSFRDTALAGPTFGHWLGIDGVGRDFFSRLWAGSGNSIFLSLNALCITFIGASLLLLAEQSGPRWIGESIRHLIGLWVAVPVVFIGLLILLILAPSPKALVLAAGLGNIPLAFRQLRIYWLEQRSATYVEASVVLGADFRHLLLQTIWPNLRPNLFSLASLLFALGVLELSGLAFLGLMGDPDFPELGSILRQNQAYLHQAPALVFLPGLAMISILLPAHGARLKKSQ
jgi:peptide/nickel transport system permease protein